MGRIATGNIRPEISARQLIEVTRLRHFIFAFFHGSKFVCVAGDFTVEALSSDIVGQAYGTQSRPGETDLRVSRAKTPYRFAERR